MSEHPICYALEVAGFTFWVRDVRGREAISSPWRLELALPLDPQTMSGEPDAFDPDDVIKAEATVIMERSSGGPGKGARESIRRITGVVTEATLSASLRGVPEVQLVVEPRFALLRFRHDIRIHRNLTVPEIVSEVATALGVKVEQRLTDSYVTRPYCVQFRESDFDYCSRLMEDEGIAYFFVEPDTLVLADNVGAYRSNDVSLPFRAAAGANLNEEAVHEIGSRAALTPGQVTLRDWNTEHPSLDMDVSAATAVEDGPEWYDFPGEYAAPDEGRRKAGLHSEAFDRAAAAITGSSTSARLVPGATFQLRDAPADAPDDEYVVRSVEHAWNRDVTGFTNRFEAQSATVVFRSARSTYVPQIFNPLTGIVCTSAPDEDIHTDELGRVKVHFHWDRNRPYDDDCSHWIPVLQDNTGHSVGIPRRDWEVMVHFLEGDPDRPVVLGRVYNGEDRFTEVLPEAKTRSGLKSMTSPSRDGSNEIRFEDRQGAEEIYVHARKDQNIRIANNRTEDIWNMASSAVKNDETVTVVNDATWSVGDDMMPTVKNNQTWDISGSRTRKIGASDKANVVGDHTLDVGGNHERTIYADDNVSAKTMKETIGGSALEQYKQQYGINVGKTCDFTIGGAYIETCDESKSETVTLRRVETVSGVNFVKAGQQLKHRFDETRKTNVNGSVLVNAGEELTLTGAERFRTSSTTASYTGTADMTLKVGESVVLLKDGLIKVKAPQKIAVLITGANNQGAGKSTQI